MSNFNKIHLLGRATRDTILRYTPAEIAVVDFGLAVNRRWQDAKGQKKEECMFIECVAYAGLARTVEKYVGKGSSVFIEGFLQLQQWTDKQKNKRSRHVVVIKNIQFLSYANNAAGDTQKEIKETADESSEA